jgi:hypothetical protein
LPNAVAVKKRQKLSVQNLLFVNAKIVVKLTPGFLIAPLRKALTLPVASRLGCTASQPTNTLAYCRQIVNYTK